MPFKARDKSQRSCHSTSLNINHKLNHLLRQTQEMHASSVCWRPVCH